MLLLENQKSEIKIYPKNQNGDSVHHILCNFGKKESCYKCCQK